MKRQKNYDKRVKVTRILLSDYLVIERVSQAAGVSMAEALHRLIEHQAQLPMLDMAIEPVKPAFRVLGKPAIQVTGKPAIRVAPVTVTAVNGAGAEHSAYLIKPKGVQYG